MGMFDFLKDIENYEDRLVDRHESMAGEEYLIVSTCRVSDGAQPYETAVSHDDYSDGDWIVVEAYSLKKHAQRGHNRWVKKMTTDPLPKVLKDCTNSEISKLLVSAQGNELIFERRVG
jgi:hypothetical protein